VASGYTRVTESTAYSSGGFGWTDTSSISSRDRGAPDDLRRDLVQNDASGARTFRVTLANGTYTVVLTMGDQSYAHDNMKVRANGATVLPDVDTSAGTFAVNTFTVAVSGGVLDLEFSDTGGADPTWVVNALTTTLVSLAPTNTPTSTPTSTPTNTPTSTPTSTPTGTFTSARDFDFGTATSPLAGGYARVTESTAFSAGAYGWTNTAGLASIDRGSPNNRWEDFVYGSANRTFQVALPDGTYTVTVTMGDFTTARDQMVVKVGGVTKLGPVDTAAGSFDYNHPFSVTVSGGTGLALDFSDAGGPDPDWVVNVVTITP
jgi:fibronectin type 3 domain-containing protein